MSAQDLYLTICPSCSGLNRRPLDTTKKAKCGHCGTDLRSEAIHDVDLATLQHIVKNSPIPVLCDFWAEWCGPCQAFAPVFKEFAEERRGSLLCVKMDTEKNEAAGAVYNIRGIPTLIGFNGGKETARQSGAMPKDALTRWVDAQIP